MAGNTHAKVNSSVRRKGPSSNYGILSGVSSTVNVADFLFGGKNLTGFWLSEYSEWLSALPQSKVHAIAEDMLNLLKEGKNTPYTGQTFSLEDAPSAMQHVMNESKGGKVLLKGCSRGRDL